MKKILAALAVSLAVFSCSNPMELGNEANMVSKDFRALTAPGVELVQATSFIHFKYGSNLQRTITARVYPKGTDTEVFVHHENADGTWSNYPAAFIEKLSDGTEIYEAYLQMFYTPTIGTKFVIEARSGGYVYYDNNNGQNYNVPLNFGTYLKNGINVRQNWASISANTVYGVVDIRNLAFTKKVNIVYTTDGWNTVKVAQATYNGPNYYYGYSTTQSPNTAGIEKWSFHITEAGATSFEYAISYDVNGQTYWDNNYGRNYKYTGN